MAAIILRLRLFAGFTVCAWLCLFGRDQVVADALRLVASIRVGSAR